MSSGSDVGTIFDTSAVIGLTERRSPTLIEIAKQLGRPIVRSITVAGELRHGAAVDNRPGQQDRQRTLDRYEQLSAWTDVEVPLDELGLAYGAVSAMATANGVTLGMNDRWIIAECMTQGAGLVTGDRRQAELAELVVENSLGTFDVVTIDEP